MRQESHESIMSKKIRLKEAGYPSFFKIIGHVNEWNWFSYSTAYKIRLQASLGKSANADIFIKLSSILHVLFYTKQCMQGEEEEPEFDESLFSKKI